MGRINFYLTCIFTISLIGLASCSERLHPTVDNNPVFYPSAPDTARIQFLTSISNSEDIEGKQSMFTTYIAGPKEVKPIKKPMGLHIQGGKIFICDPAVGGLEIIDLDNMSFNYFNPGGRGTINVPRNCFVDDEGTLFVCDLKRNEIVVFNKDLEFVNSFGDKKFIPNDIFVTGDTIFASDPVNHRINVYSKSSQQLFFTFPEAKPGDEGYLYNPINICMEGDRIYVTDFGEFKIKIFDLNGEFLSSVGSYGKYSGQFVRPKGIAVDREQNLFVTDAGFENVQIFNKENQLLLFFGGPYRGPGDMYLPVDVTIDYKHLSYFEKYVDPAFSLKYLIFVCNQFGPDKISVYGRIEPK